MLVEQRERSEVNGEDRRKIGIIEESVDLITTTDTIKRADQRFMIYILINHVSSTLESGGVED